MSLEVPVFPNEANTFSEKNEKSRWAALKKASKKISIYELWATFEFGVLILSCGKNILKSLKLL